MLEDLWKTQKTKYEEQLDQVCEDMNKYNENAQEQWNPPTQEEVIKTMEATNGTTGTDGWTGDDISALPRKRKRNLLK